jgi:hypothetical protein
MSAFFESKICKQHSINPHTVDELKQSIRETIIPVKVIELKILSNRLLNRLEVCLRAELKHFEHPL